MERKRWMEKMQGGREENGGKNEFKNEVNKKMIKNDKKTKGIKMD